MILSWHLQIIPTSSIYIGTLLLTTRTLSTILTRRHNAVQIAMPTSSTATPPPAVFASTAAHTQTAGPMTTTLPHQPPLPAAHLFDILPPLHQLLSRLEPSLNPYNTSTTTSTTGDAGDGPLSYKEIATAAQFLKARIRKAMAECAKLGDVERGIDEQEDEIEELESRIARQRGVLGRLGGMASDIMEEGAG